MIAVTSTMPTTSTASIVEWLIDLRPVGGLAVAVDVV
jgi:hypothetical protein